MSNNKKLKAIQDKMNSEDLDDFLGLSPSQMHLILYNHPNNFKHIFSINHEFDSNFLTAIPILDDLLFLFELIQNTKLVKATKNGNLPVKLVNEVFNRKKSTSSLPRPKIQSEEYFRELFAARISAMQCGWITLEKNKFLLSDAGREILNNGFSRNDFIKLLNYFMFTFNWSFPTGWEHCEIVQQAVIFELYILNKKAQNSYFDLKSFGEIFLKAFPLAPQEVDDDYCEESYKPRIIVSTLQYRFLMLFCQRFGLITVNKKSSYSQEFGLNYSYKTTLLYKELFTWFSRKTS